MFFNIIFGKAMLELDRGNVYAAYELYISAQQFNAAHNIAVLELAPDAIIRKDFELLCNLFKPLSTPGRPEKIDGWFVRGQVYITRALRKNDTMITTNIAAVP